MIGEPVSGRVLAASEALRDALRDFDLSLVPEVECVLVADELALAEKVCGAARLLAGARAVQCGAHKDKGFSEPAAWLAHQAGTTTRQAKDALTTAASLAAFPATKEALLAGDVSIPQASEITKAAEELPGTEAWLLEAAKSGNLTKLRDEVRERRLKSVTPDDLHRRQVAARKFRHWRDALGMVCFEGALPPETGIPFTSRIEREAARLHREARKEGGAEPFEVHRADALVAYVMGDEGQRRGVSTELVIVCDLYAWRRGHPHEGEPCHLLGGGPIPVELAKELSKDAFLKTVLHDGKDIQRIKHHGRRYTAELLTALDLGPVPSFPGRLCANCKQTRGLQRDHADPIAHTGPTSVENMRDLCYPCHAEKTEGDRRAGLLGQKAKARGPGPAPKRRSSG